MIFYENNNVQSEFLTKMNELLPRELLLDRGVIEWWRCVFVEKDGRLQYDSYYDNYHVCEHSQQTFGELLSQIRQSLQSLSSLTLRISGLWTNCLPLRYECEQAPHLNVEWYNEKVYHLSEGSVKIEKGDAPVTVYVPMTTDTLNAMATDALTWKDIIGNAKEDYTIGGVPMKIVKLEYDE